MTDKTENKQPLPPVQINLQYVKDMSFEAPGMPMSLLAIKSTPAINVNIDLKAGKTNNEKCYTVDLTLHIEAKNKENKYKNEVDLNDSDLLSLSPIKPEITSNKFVKLIIYKLVTFIYFL